MKKVLFEVKKISKSYGSVRALEDVSVTVDQGDIFGIIGISGAGKSTLLRMLARLIDPTEGNIFFHGHDIGRFQGAGLRTFRKKIGMIFQQFNLLGARTVAENISLPLEIAGVPKEKRAKRVDELLSLVDLQNKRDVYPPLLSGGQKQRVGIARALANHPEVLLCDEATSALDPKTTKEILNLLKDINKKLHLTIVLITHQMEVIKHICNKVAVIEKGEIIEKGLVSEVFSDPKESVTKSFLQNTSHEIPEQFFKEPSPQRKLLRLSFRGKAAGEPIISHIVRKFHVDANILLGWIDNLHTTTVGTLIIELTGSSEGIEKTLLFLQENAVHCEVLEK
jgi:D-methionine transport system ATP-binding protein